jgi:hypothetical protein
VGLLYWRALARPLLSEVKARWCFMYKNSREPSAFCHRSSLPYAVPAASSSNEKQHSRRHRNSSNAIRNSDSSATSGPGYNHRALPSSSRHPIRDPEG